MTAPNPLPSSRRALLQDIAAAALAQQRADRDGEADPGPAPEVSETMRTLRRLLAVRGD